MVRPVHLFAALALVLSAGIALAAPGTAFAHPSPPGEVRHVVVVDRMSDSTFATLAKLGASLGQLSRLDHAIGANNRLKFAALFIMAGLLLALALFGVRAAVTAVPAALLVNLALGMGQVSNEVLLCAAISAGTALVAFGLALICRSETALLALYG